MGLDTLMGVLGASGNALHCGPVSPTQTQPPQRPQLAPVLGPFLCLFVQPADREPVKGFVDAVPTKPFPSLRESMLKQAADTNAFGQPQGFWSCVWWGCHTRRMGGMIL